MEEEAACNPIDVRLTSKCAWIGSWLQNSLSWLKNLNGNGKIASLKDVQMSTSVPGEFFLPSFKLERTPLNSNTVYHCIQGCLRVSLVGIFVLFPPLISGWVMSRSRLSGRA